MRRRPVSIYRGLLFSVLSVILLLSGAILAISAFGARAAVETLSGSVIRKTIREVESRLEGFFDPVIRELHIARFRGETGLLSIENTQVLGAIAVPYLQQHLQVSAYILADDSGREFIMFHGAGRWTNRQTRPDQWGERSRWLEWTDIDATPVETWKAVGYDPRTRPWFQQAVAPAARVEEVYWTAPYRFFTSKEPGITASSAYTDAAGVRHVFGLDVLLRDLSSFTTALEVSRNGKAFVLTDDGRVIGLPPDPGLDTHAKRMAALLRAPADLGIPVVADMVASEALQAEGALEPHRFESGGAAWWGASWPFSLGPGRHLIISVAIPEDDLLGDLGQLRTGILTVTVAALLLAFWMTAALSRRYSQPIEALVRDSDRIRLGDLERGEPIRSHVKEVRALAAAHESMRAGLRTLMKLERDLQLARQIQQNTFPDRLPVVHGFQLDAWSEPAEETGGDTYDLVGVGSTLAKGTAMVLPEEVEHAVLLLADATGHGVGPALSVTQVRSMLRMGVRFGQPLSQIIRHMNQQLYTDLGAGRFITTWLGELSGADHTLTSFSAGQAPLLHYRADSHEVDVLFSDVPPLGILEDLEVGGGMVVSMGHGDIFAVISDGVYEAANPEREQFGLDRVKWLILKYRERSPREIVTQLREAIEKFTRGVPAADDRTSILVKRL